MGYEYDDQNIFAKILRGEIPCDTVMETEHTLAFRDINPRAPQHVLLIPKAPYVTYDHFAEAASDAEIVDFVRALATLSARLGVQPCSGAAGYRLVSNAGPDGNQEVPHMHVHLLAGRSLGVIVTPPE